MPSDEEEVFSVRLIRALAERFDTSPATVRRWLADRNAPHPTIQRMILKDLMRAVEEGGDPS